MDKKDLVFFLGGLVVLIIIAVVIQPMMTGESPDMGVPELPFIGQQDREAPLPPPPTPVPLAQIRIPHPSTVEGGEIGDHPARVWDGSPIRLQHVDPATYHLTREDTHIPAHRPVDDPPPTADLATYATFGAGTGDGITSGTPLTTEVFTIPFPRWELWYTLETSVDPADTGSVDGDRITGIVGYPRFTITVIDADDPGRVVATLSPAHGIIDSSLWDGGSDPRPWKHKFFEGGRSYYMIVERRLVDSYEIEIKVPVQPGQT
ncbi:MAG: hypothetical protein D5R99_02785 [Methanocalculus sp. MSAO_Arc1]|uniref:hypothetical protein n=1 Tax=Methanocalculus TaxID=71151 RepID=UPI000FF6167B|nr:MULTISPECIES: hypothetical protein [unclassified Methanocalculus]MCP1661923.1 hypothetical protein [Methanocalculus sp. AMF5]RQD81192.1 MAG: hypothetical protein D5R99_02785 [Methanocalculus sp. MSAO_Arc1]